MIVQLSSGNGPLECSLAVLNLYLALEKEYGIDHIHRLNEYDKHNPPRSIRFNTDLDLSEMEGTILCTFHSPYRPNHKRKNWFVDVSIFKDKDENVSLEDLERHIRFETFRSSGPGGQHVNKTSSGVRAIHDSGITVESTEERSQYLNKSNCIEKIRNLILERQLEQIAEYDNSMWRSHERIERGNPVRIYEGIPLKRVK